MKAPIFMILSAWLSARAFGMNLPVIARDASSLSGQPSNDQTLGNFLGAYALAVDAKNQSAVAALFSADAIATYTSPDQTVRGNVAIAQHDLYAFSGVNTFHSTEPMRIQKMAGDSSGTIDAISYFTATIFGKDCYTGQIVTAYGKYQDTISQVNGAWLITRRVQTYANPAMPFIGNVAIVLGPACNSSGPQ